MMISEQNEFLIFEVDEEERIWIKCCIPLKVNYGICKEHKYEFPQIRLINPLTDEGIYQTLLNGGKVHFYFLQSAYQACGFMIFEVSQAENPTPN